MGFKFNEQQKAALKKYADIKSTKAFKNFMENMKDLLNPEKNTIMSQALIGRTIAPQSFSMLPPKSDNDEYANIGPEQLIARAKHLVDAIGQELPAESAEFETEEERDKAANQTYNLAYLLNVVQVFNDKYEEFVRTPELESKVYSGEVPVEKYRAFKMGKSIIDEISKLTPDMDLEKQFDDGIDTEQRKLAEEKTKYLHNQKKLRHELSQIDSGKPNYYIGTYKVNGKYTEPVSIYKSDLKKNPLYYSDTDNPLDKIMQNIDENIEREKQVWLKKLRKQSELFVTKADKVETEYYTKIEDIKSQYNSAQQRYDELALQLSKEQKFDEFEEYNRLQQAIDDAMNAPAEDVGDEYKRNTGWSDRGKWSVDFDRDSVEEYQEDLELIDRQIKSLEERIKKENIWIESAEPAYESAKKAAELGNHVDEVIEEKIELINRQTADISALVQDTTRPRIERISDIPKEAFSSATLSNIKESAEQQFLRYLEAQRGFTHTLKNWVKFDSIVNDLNNIVDLNSKMKFFPENSMVLTGLDSGYIDGLKKAFTENNPKDPEKTDVIRRFGIIRDMLASYEKQLDEVQTAKLDDYDAKIAALDNELTGREKPLQQNAARIEYLKKNVEALNIEYNKALDQNRKDLESKLTELKNTRDTVIKNAELSQKKELDGKKKLSNDEKKRIKAGYEFEINRAKTNYDIFAKQANAAAQEAAANLKKKLEEDLKNNAQELRDRTDIDKKTTELIAEYKKSAAGQKAALLKEKEAAGKAFNNLHESVKKFREGEYRKLSNDVDNALTNIVDYLNSVSDVYTENAKLRDSNISLLKSIPELEKQAAEKTKEEAEPTITQDELTQLEFDITRTKEDNKSHKASLEYLKKMKNGLEKGRSWCEKKVKLKHLQDKEKYEDLRKELAERDRLLARAKADRDEQMNSLEQYRSKNVAAAQKDYDSGLEFYNKKKETIRQIKSDIAHAKRTLNTLKEGAKAIVAAKNEVSENIRKEQDVLKKHFEAQHKNYDAMEDRLMAAVSVSKKKYGRNSGLFRDVLDDIAEYQSAKDALPATDENNPLDPDAVEAFRERTENLKASLDAYIQARFDKNNPLKKTKQGQVRLDAVMELRNCIERHERDLKAYKDNMEALWQRQSKIEIKPQSLLEFENLKTEDALKKDPDQPDTNLAQNFCDYGNIVSIEMDTTLAEHKTSDLEKGIASGLDPRLDNIKPFELPTEDEKTAFTNEDLELDRDEEQQKTADVIKAAFDAKKEAEAETERLTKLYFKNEHEKNVVIPEVEFSDDSYADLKNDIKNIPEDLRPAVLEFNKLIKNVPADYGFEEYNKGRWFFNRMSLDQYKKENRAMFRFIDDNNLLNPVPSPDDIQKIKDFDKEMAKKVNAETLGYKEYFAAELEKDSQKDPMTQEEFLMDKFKLKDHMEVVNFLIEKRREAAQKEGKLDPRTTIKNYGSFVKSDEFVADEIKNKLEQARKASEKRARIIKEINAYDKKMASVKPGYGFKDYIKAKNVLSLDDYIKNGIGSFRYALDNKLISPQKKYSNFKGEWTEEMKKELADYKKLMDKNRAYDYKNAYSEMVADERKNYEACGMAKLAYLKDNPKLIDPRVKYATDIAEDGILLQMFKPEAVNDISKGFYNKDQLIEDELPEDYEEHMLEIIARDRKYKEAAKELAANPIFGKRGFEGDYYEGFEKYPDDLKEKIREFDMIMATVPDDYGYTSFEKNVDFMHRFSKDEYIRNGFGKKYFCQLHQMVDPRIDPDLARKIREYDAGVGPLDAKAHKEWLNYKKQNPGEDINFEDYKQKIYGEEQLKRDAIEVRDNHWVKTKEEDPRPENYGRIVLNKEAYKKFAKPIFDDSERITRNDKIIEEMKVFIDKIKDVPADYGFEKYEKGQNIEDYVTLREYKLSDEAVRKYAIDHELDNPIYKYRQYVSVDAELRRRINETTADYRKKVAERNEAFAKEKETDPLFEKREAERAKTKALIDKLDKDFKDQRDEFYKGNLVTVNKRRAYRALKQNVEKISGDTSLETKKIQGYTANIEKNLFSARDLLTEENYNAHLDEINVQRYCDQLTMDDIESEEEAFRKFDEICAGQIDIFGNQTIVPISASEYNGYAKRQQRVEELKKLRTALAELEKKKPHIAAEIKKDPKRLDELMDKIKSQSKNKAKSAEPKPAEPEKLADEPEPLKVDNPVLN